MKIITIRAVLAFAAVLLLGGCVVVPVPLPDGKTTAEWKEKARSLVAERASREKTEGTLGRPSIEFPNLKVVGYVWIDTNYGVLGAVGDGAGYFDVYARWLLCIAFDDEGRATRYEVTTVSAADQWERAYVPPSPASSKRDKRIQLKIEECAARCSVIKPPSEHGRK
jgi:hypothetical protein